MKIWAIDTNIELKNCDATVIKSKEKIQDYIIQLCKKLNIERFGDCSISQFTNYDRHTIQAVQMAQFEIIYGYFDVANLLAHISIFSECPFDMNIFLDVTQEVFGTNDAVAIRNNKFAEWREEIVTSDL